MKKYFLHDGKGHVGPFSMEDLKGKKILKETPIWYEGITIWTNAGDVDELKKIFVEPPPFQVSTVPPEYKGSGNYRQPNNSPANRLREFNEDEKSTDDVIVLFFAAGEDRLLQKAFEDTNEFSSHELAAKLSTIKRTRQHDINNIKSSEIFWKIDVALAALCGGPNGRIYARKIYRRIFNKTSAEALTYVNSLIDTYNIDLPEEDIEREAEEKEKKIIRIKRISAIALLLFLLFQLFEAKSALSIADGEATLIKFLWEWVRTSIMDLPDIFGYLSSVSTLISVLLLSYGLKIIIAGIVLVKDSTDYDFGTGKKSFEVPNIFLALCAIECFVLFMCFDFGGSFWEFAKSAFMLQIPSYIVLWLVFPGVFD